MDQPHGSLGKEARRNKDFFRFEKMVTTSILVFPYLENTFHFHVYPSVITLGEILAQLGAGDLEHPISFARRKFS
jgi:hypothetical protein